MRRYGMKVKVRLFAVFRESLKADWVDVEVESGTTVSQAFDRLFPADSAESKYKDHCAFALNRLYVDGDAAISEGDEIAFIPPVAGG